MVLFGVMSCVAIVGLCILVSQSRGGRGSGLFLLSALPLALLFLIAPVPVVAYQSIKAFQAISEAGRSDMNTAGELALGIMRPMWPGNIGCVLVLCVAAGFQARALRRDPLPARGILSIDDPPDSDATASSPGRRWANWILAASALLAIPVGILHYLTSGIAPLIVEAGRVLISASASPESTVAGMALSEFSAMISARLIAAALGGFGLTFLLFAIAMFNLVAVQYTRRSDALEKLSWAVFAIVTAAATWNLVWITVSMRSF